MLSKEEKEYWESIIKALQDIYKDLKKLNDEGEKNNEKN